MADDFELFESSKSGLRSRVHETNDFAPLDRDRNVLAKSGKKQVLKVATNHHSTALSCL